MPKPDYVLKIDNVSKNFGGIIAANNININVMKGVIHGIIGPNGAGKTTLFNLITGVYKVTQGDITFNGVRVNDFKPHQIAVMGIARTFQNIRLFNELTAFDNLMTACQKNITYGFFSSLVAAKKCRMQEKEMTQTCEIALKDVGLLDQISQKAKNLPYGMQRRLEIARALVTKPKLLLLDEPAAGMNEEESTQLTNFIKQIRDNYDITIVIIDHHMDVMMSISDDMSVLNFGNLLAQGTPEQIQKNQQVIEAYLGVDKKRQ